MVAVASLGTLHPAIAGKEVAAHAQSKAVGLILANELARLDRVQGQDQAGGLERLTGVVQAGTRLDEMLLRTVVQGAGQTLPVRDSWVGTGEKKEKKRWIRKVCFALGIIVLTQNPTSGIIIPKFAAHKSWYLYYSLCF